METSPNASSPRKGIPRGILVAAILLSVAAVAVLLVLTYLRLTELSREVAGLRRVTRTVAETADSARRQAVRAEQNALKAALGRAQAEEEASEARAAAAKSKAEVKQAKQEAARARQEAARIRKERDEKLDAMQQALSRLVETRRTALGLIMNLDSEAIQFDFDKAALKPHNKELLSKIAGILLTSKGHHIFVYGHTDDVGTEAYNQQLSQRRAKAVRDYLVASFIDPTVVTAEGFGKVQSSGGGDLEGSPGQEPAGRDRHRGYRAGLPAKDPPVDTPQIVNFGL